MIRPLAGFALALALLTISGGRTGQPVFADGEQPDLNIELVGLKAGSQRVVQLRVTNVSAWWADETTARVETLSPSAGNVVDNIKVLELDPQQSRVIEYTLAADCAEHVVKAMVRAAKNYAGVPEDKIANNEIPRQGQTGEVCPKPNLGQSGVVQNIPDASVLIGPDLGQSGVVKDRPGVSDILEVPEYMRPGTHELNFEPSALRSLSRHTSSDGNRSLSADSRDPGDMLVGWDGGSGVSQTAVNFDLAKLIGVGHPAIAEAHLSFVERPEAWREASGSRADVTGCVSTLDFATNDWGVPPENFIAQNLLFRSRYLTDAFIPQVSTYYDSDGGVARWRAFDVGGHVRSQMFNRDDPALWFGYVLRGAEGEDGARSDSCTSRISDMLLWVTYVVGSS
jgi:hypothetical protein